MVYWLISACLIESAAFITDLYPITLFCTSWFTPGLSPGGSKSYYKGGHIVKIEQIVLAGNARSTSSSSC